MKALFIVNPNSGPAWKKLPKAHKERIDATAGVELAFTEHAGHAREMAHQAVEENCERVIAIGGDGTVHEIGTALIGSNTALGVVPMGSGNGYARSMGIPLKAAQAIEHALSATPKAVDTGKANNTPFLGVAGWGFDALVAHKFAEGKGRGLVNYVKTSISEFSNYEAANFEISIGDEQIQQNAFAVVAANTPEYGNNARISPNSNPMDGLLELVIIDPLKAQDIPGMSARLFSGNIHESKFTKVMQAEQFMVSTQKEMAHLDGEPIFLERETQVMIDPASLLVLSGD